jgi:hypothetical protein
MIIYLNYSVTNHKGLISCVITINGLYNIGFYINTPIVSILISNKSKLITLIEDVTDKEYRYIV